VGTVTVDHRAVDRYRQHLIEHVLAPGALRGTKVVLDAANGAAALLAAEVYGALGAIVLAIHDAPDG
jgi:phosphoglucosamine mutase